MKESLIFFHFCMGIKISFFFSMAVANSIGLYFILIGRLLQDPVIQTQIINGVPIADIMRRHHNDNLSMRQNHPIQDLQDLHIVNDNRIIGPSQQ